MVYRKVVSQLKYFNIVAKVLEKLPVLILNLEGTSTNKEVTGLEEFNLLKNEVFKFIL